MSERGSWLRWSVQTALLLLIVGLLLAQRLERTSSAPEHYATPTASAAPVRAAETGGTSPTNASATAQPAGQPTLSVTVADAQTAGALMRQQQELASAQTRQEAFFTALERTQTEALRLAGTVGLPDGAYQELRNILEDCKALQTAYEMLAENLLNIITPGYKAIRLNHGANGRIAGMTRLFTRGSAEQTGIWSDVMLNDATSFFCVTLDDGTRGYSRDGTLRINSQGELRTNDGYALQPPITGIPTGATDPSITPSGNVQYIDVNGQTQTCGRIQLYNFINPAGLTFTTPNGPSSFGTGFFKETDASGQATAGCPGDAGFGCLTSTWVEGSNVSTFEVAMEFTRLSQMLTAMQARLAMLHR